MQSRPAERLSVLLLLFDRLHLICTPLCCEVTCAFAACACPARRRDPRHAQAPKRVLAVDAAFRKSHGAAPTTVSSLSASAAINASFWAGWIGLMSVAPRCMSSEVLRQR